MKVKQAKAENFFHPDAKTLDMVPAPIIERQDSRIEGEICLLIESPYRILRVSLKFWNKPFYFINCMFSKYKYTYPETLNKQTNKQITKKNRKPYQI